MAIQITTGALRLVRNALGAVGQGVQRIFLDDSDVRQFVEVNQLVSAANPETQDKGLFVISEINSHAGAGGLSDEVDIWGDNTRLNMGGITLTDFDIWIHAAFCGADDDTLASAAAWEINWSTLTQGVTDGQTSLGNAPFATWNSFTENGGPNPGVSSSRAFTPFRIPRSIDGLVFRSFASGVVIIEGALLAELVPVGLRPSGF